MEPILQGLIYIVDAARYKTRTRAARWEEAMDGKYHRFAARPLTLCEPCSHGLNYVSVISHIRLRPIFDCIVIKVGRW